MGPWALGLKDEVHWTHMPLAWIRGALSPRAHGPLAHGPMGPWLGYSRSSADPWALDMGVHNVTIDITITYPLWALFIPCTELSLAQACTPPYTLLGGKC